MSAGRRCADPALRCPGCDGFGTKSSSTGHVYPCSSCGGSGRKKSR